MGHARPPARTVPTPSVLFAVGNCPERARMKKFEITAVMVANAAGSTVGAVSDGYVHLHSASVRD